MNHSKIVDNIVKKINEIQSEIRKTNNSIIVSPTVYNLLNGKKKMNKIELLKDFKLSEKELEKIGCKILSKEHVKESKEYTAFNRYFISYKGFNYRLDCWKENKSDIEAWDWASNCWLYLINNKGIHYVDEGDMNMYLDIVKRSRRKLKPSQRREEYVIPHHGRKEDFNKRIKNINKRLLY